MKQNKNLKHLGKKIPDTNLTLLEDLGINESATNKGSRRRLYKCLCDCGNTIITRNLDKRLKTCGSKECPFWIERKKICGRTASVEAARAIHRKKAILLENNEHGFILIKCVYQGYIKAAVERKMEWHLTPQDIEALWIKQNGKCAQTGLKLNCGTTSANHTWSLDRINNNGHYTVDNIQIVSKAYNMIKASRTDEELKTLAYLLYQNLSIQEARKFNSMREGDFQEALKNCTRTSRK